MTKNEANKQTNMILYYSVPCSSCLYHSLPPQRATHTHTHGGRQPHHFVIKASLLQPGLGVNGGWFQPLGWFNVDISSIHGVSGSGSKDYTRTITGVVVNENPHCNSSLFGATKTNALNSGGHGRDIVVLTTKYMFSL